MPAHARRRGSRSWNADPGAGQAGLAGETRDRSGPLVSFLLPHASAVSCVRAGAGAARRERGELPPVRRSWSAARLVRNRAAMPRALFGHGEHPDSEAIIAAYLTANVRAGMTGRQLETARDAAIAAARLGNLLPAAPPQPAALPGSSRSFVALCACAVT